MANHHRSPSSWDRNALIEGRHACMEALEEGVPLSRALVSEGDAALTKIVRKLGAAGVLIEHVPRSKLDQLSSHGAHQGIICETAPYSYAALADIVTRSGSGDALVVVLDHITDEGNFGAIVRSAEVVGAAGVVIAKARSASVGSGAYKTSAGAVSHIPIARVANIASTLQVLKEAHFWTVAASEHADRDVWHTPFGGRIAVVMGSEDAGISRIVLENCDFICSLPQRGKVESLNVAQAATVMCYEWLRRISVAGDD